MRVRARRVTVVVDNELWPTTAFSWYRVISKIKAQVMTSGGMVTGPNVGIGLEVHTNQFLDGDRLFAILRRITRRLKKAGIVDVRSDWYLLNARIYDTDEWKIVLTLESEYED